jgi:hypothetical protein
MLSLQQIVIAQNIPNIDLFASFFHDFITSISNSLLIDHFTSAIREIENFEVNRILLCHPFLISISLYIVHIVLEILYQLTITVIKYNVIRAFP